MRQEGGGPDRPTPTGGPRQRSEMRGRPAAADKASREGKGTGWPVSGGAS